MLGLRQRVLSSVENLMLLTLVKLLNYEPLLSAKSEFSLVVAVYLHLIPSSHPPPHTTRHPITRSGLSGYFKN